jgi:hypothetical protein
MEMEMEGDEALVNPKGKLSPANKSRTGCKITHKIVNEPQ